MVNIPISELRELAALQCPVSDVCDYYGITRATFFRMLSHQPEVRKAWNKGKAEGRIRLRKRQARLSGENAPMAKFLGTQYLGQREVLNQEVSGPGQGPIRVSKIEVEFVKADENSAT